MNRLGRLLVIFNLVTSAGCATTGSPGPRDSATERMAAMNEQRREQGNGQFRDIPRFYFFYYGWQF